MVGLPPRPLALEGLREYILTLVEIQLPVLLGNLQSLFQIVIHHALINPQFFADLFRCILPDIQHVHFRIEVVFRKMLRNERCDETGKIAVIRTGEAVVVPVHLRNEIRTQFIKAYVEGNDLEITAYQDYGWDPIPLK